MSGWEIAAPVLLGVLLLGLLIFSILKPSSRVMFGIFVERKLNEKKKERPRRVTPEEEDTQEWPKRKE